VSCPTKFQTKTTIWSDFSTKKVKNRENEKELEPQIFYTHPKPKNTALEKKLTKLREKNLSEEQTMQNQGNMVWGIKLVKIRGFTFFLAKYFW
jgi:hypothetical protein